MPVLGFSNGRCSSKPKELYIRKVSLSGCSLSSGKSSSSSFDSSTSSTNSFVYACSSSSSSSSLSNGCSSRSMRSPLERHVDPLAQHPTYTPPPRLHDRRLLDTTPMTTTLYLGGGAGGVDEEEKDLSTVSVEPVDYFSVPMRPTPQQFPRSRWSDSTIASLDLPESESDSDGGSETSEEVEELLEEEEESDSNNDVSVHVHDDESHYQFQHMLEGHHRSMPNFSYKRETSLDKRPQVKTLDSLDEFVKRGGWKRRGVIFHSEEVNEVLDMDL
ncbi:hypothetical protein CP533_3441 [Ophiocordyceps camponoti-saundersi (nom. inval.)]|nr:hypothetical protein CP533_3441 [Ophiocordyceps camponoti-saundersi (nom. inval.)]